MRCNCKFDTAMGKVQWDPKNVPFDCPAAWNIFATGNTKGVFQLESFLGMHYAKAVKPKSIDELAALIALIRPSCLNSFLDNGKSVADNYVLRKNGEESIRYIHESLEPILKDTQGVCLFQENLIEIGVSLANMSEEESDSILRYGVGKKRYDILEKGKKIFAKGCEENGIPSDVVQEIWDWVLAAGRYGFNKCLSPSTLVETERGYTTLDELVIGDSINTPEGFSTVTDKIDQGIQDIYRITLECGTTIECTMSHKFLCEDGEIRPLFEIFKKDLKIVTE